MKGLHPGGFRPASALRGRPMCGGLRIGRLDKPCEAGEGIDISRTYVEVAG